MLRLVQIFLRRNKSAWQKKSRLLVLIISVRRVRRSLRAVQPVDVPQSPSHLPLLLLRASELGPLFLRLELHVALCIRSLGASRRRSFRGWGLRRDVAGCNGRRDGRCWLAVFETVEVHCKVALLSPH